MVYILGSLAILASVLMVVVVMIQNSKGGGINSAFGGTSGVTQVLGQRRSNESIETITWSLAGALAVLALVANITLSAGNNTEKDQNLRMQNSIDGNVSTTNTTLPDVEGMKQQEAAPAPAAQPAEQK